MHNIFKAAILIFLVNNLIAQPLRFYDTAFSLKYKALDVSADDKGGWLTIAATPDSSFSIIQFDYCGKVITNQKYPLPVDSKMYNPQIIYIGKERSVITATLVTPTDSKILVFNSVGGIIGQAKLFSAGTLTHNYNPVLSAFDGNNILLAFNYDSNALAKSRIIMLDNNLNERWTRHVTAESHIRWVKMLDLKNYAIADGNKVMKFDTLGNNLWSRIFTDRQMVFNSVVAQDTQLVFLADNVDTSKLNYKQIISLDQRSGKFIWRSGLIKSMRANYLLEYNSRLLFDNGKNYIFNAIDTIPGDSIPALYAHKFDGNGNLIGSTNWSAKDSVIDYKTSLLNDGNFGVSILIDSAGVIGLANVKANQQYEGACGTGHDSVMIFRELVIDTLGLKNIPESAVDKQGISIVGGPDTLKIARDCEIFDLKDGKIPTELCKGDSVFLAGITLKNATYHWNNGSSQQGIWVKVAGDYSENITYCEKTITITYQVHYKTYQNEVFDMEECDYPHLIDANKGPRTRYKWFNGDTTSFTNVPGPGVYTVDVTQCEMTYKVTFNVSLKKFKDESFDFKICNYPQPIYAYQGAAIHGATYLWDDGSVNGTRFINDPGTYKVTVSYCQSMFVQTFNITPPDFKDQVDTFIICDYPQPIYAGWRDSLIKGASYVWDDGSTNGTRFISTPGTYKVTVNLCKTSYVETFTIKAPYYQDQVDTFIICDYPQPLYAGVRDSLIKGVTYMWDDGSTNGARSISNPGNYKVTVSLCKTSYVETFTIKLREFADSSYTFTMCDYPQPLYAFQGPNILGAIYKWDDGSTNGTREINGPGTYKVTVDYCRSKFVQTYNIIKRPFADSSYTFIFCDYPDTLFAFQGPDIHGATYNWNDGSTKASLQITAPGTYKVTVNYCLSSFVQTFMTGSSGLDVQIKDTILNKTCKELKDTLAPIKLKAYSGSMPDSDLSFSWNTNQTTNEITIKEFGIYTATIKHCTDSFKRKFTVQEKDYLLFPNVFPPNSTFSDSNKTFRPFLNDPNLDIKNYHLEVYNRWGNRVFETNKFSEAWTGDHERSGEPAPMDTYMYFGTSSSSCDDKKTNNPKAFKGTVTLIR